MPYYDYKCSACEHIFEENYKIVDRRPGDITSAYADTTKANKVLGWKAEYDIHRMCEDTWRWQLMNPKGYSK